MHKVKLKFKYSQITVPNHPFSLEISYKNPLTNESDRSVMRNERGESKLNFLKRMIRLVKDKEKLADIVKANILSSSVTYDNKNMEQDLINQLENLTVELDIDINKTQ